MLVQRSFPVAPAELFGVLVDERFLAARDVRFGGVGDTRVERNERAVVVTTPRRLPLEHVPGPFRAFVGDGTVTQIDEWTELGTAAFRGNWVLQAPRAPVDISGHHEITDHTDGSLYAVTALVEVHVPLIGGRLAKEIVGYLVQLVTEEQEFAAEHLSRGHPPRSDAG